MYVLTKYICYLITISYVYNILLISCLPLKIREGFTARLNLVATSSLALPGNGRYFKLTMSNSMTSVIGYVLHFHMPIGKVVHIHS